MTREADRIVHQVLVRAAERAWMTPAGVSGATGVSVERAKKEMEQLVADGHAELYVGKRRRRYYRLTASAVPPREW